MSYYGSPENGLTYLASAAADAGYIKAVYVAHGGKLPADETEEDDGAT